MRGFWFLRRDSSAGPGPGPDLPPAELGKGQLKLPKIVFEGDRPSNGRFTLEDRNEQPLGSLTMGYEDARMLKMDDRTILWISPLAIEEGALIRTNSLILNPLGF